jgi:hypothetical protein
MKYILLIMIWTGNGVNGTYLGPFSSHMMCENSGETINKFFETRLKPKDYKLMCVGKGDI